MKRTIFVLSLTVLFFLLAAGCGTGGELTVSDAWARPAAAGGNSAVYFVIENSGAEDALLGASVAVADSAEMHRSVMDEGVMRMEMQPSVAVPGGGRVAFEPGGLHIMLIGLKEDLNPGDSLEVTLTFEKAGEITLQVPVEER